MQVGRDSLLALSHFAPSATVGGLSALVLLLILCKSSLMPCLGAAVLAWTAAFHAAWLWPCAVLVLVAGVATDLGLLRGQAIKPSDMVVANTQHLLAAVRAAGTFTPPVPTGDTPVTLRDPPVDTPKPPASAEERTDADTAGTPDAAPGAGGAAAAAGPPSPGGGALAVPNTEDPDHGHHVFADIPHSAEKVRGANYLHDGVKEAAKPSLFSAVHVECFFSAVRMTHVAQRRNGFLQRARAAGDTRQYFIIAYNCPPKPYVTMIMYFAAEEQNLALYPPFQRLWESFHSQDDEWRNQRFKLIPSIPECPWAVKWAVGNTRPVLLARRLAHDYHISREGKYVEMDCDVESSAWATRIVGTLRHNMSSIVIDLAFTLEGRSEEELPEAVLGAIRLRYINLKQCATLRLQ
ncbi:EDR2L [Symbiodinium sp. KB8]|nr:EDR2L [Symbiodinium sp. KB8]